MKVIAVGIMIFIGALIRMRGAGRSSVISTSKIKKMTATKKNRREKGRRADLLGSKPHSKGEIFSRSREVFFEISCATVIKMRAREKEVVKISRVVKIKI